MRDAVCRELIQIFGERVAFHKLERQVYSRDAGSLPTLFTITLKTVPEAVVQPANTNELLLVLALATKHQIPLVPRGSGTAGYGGAVPTQGGIVVDFYRLDSILNIDETNYSATVEPGVRWQQLEDSLRSHGLALQSYPSSAISATVGGWLAAGGGAGIGSYQFGYLSDAIVEIELITPNGVFTLGQNDMGLVSGLSGTTGFISRVTLKVRKATGEKVSAAGFNSLESFLETVHNAKDTSLPLWHVGYSCVNHQLLSREALIRQIGRDKIHRDTTDLPILPDLPDEGVYGVFVGPPSSMGSLTKFILSAGGKLLDQQAADFIWQERFYPMRQKALGPSIIPGEVTVPAVKLPLLLGRAKQKLKRSFSLEGTLINDATEATALFMFLDDERRLGFTLAYWKSLALVSEAKKLGGRAYAIGMLLTSETADQWGEERLRQIYEFKKKVDPANIMNPAKIFPASLDNGSPVRIIEILFKISEAFAWIIERIDRVLWQRSFKQTGRSLSIAKKYPSGEDIGWDAFACSGCGYCRTVCTELSVLGWESASPRGKFAFLKNYLKGKTKLDERMADMFFMCATCRRCDAVCQARIPILQDWDLGMRPALWEKGFNLPTFHRGTTENVLNEHNPMGHPHSKRSDFLPLDVRYQDKGEIAYWVGCTASYAMKQLAENPLRILNAGGIEPVLFKEDEWCCGSDIVLYGRTDDIMDTVRHNIEAMRGKGVKKLIVHCPGCWTAFSLYYPLLAKKLDLDWDVEIEHITETMESLIKAGKIKLKEPVNLKVTYHDSCHLGRRGGILEPPRQVIKAIPGIELVEMPQNKQDSPCCGRQLFQYTTQGAKPYVDRAVEARATGASALINNCPGCQVAYILGAREAGIEDVECLDITDLVCISMGMPVLAYKVIARMARQGYDQVVKSKIEQDIPRSFALLAPHHDRYKALPGKRQR